MELPTLDGKTPMPDRHDLALALPRERPGCHLEIIAHRARPNDETVVSAWP